MAVTSLIETSRKSTYFSDFALTVIKAWIPYKRSVTKDPKGRHFSNDALLLFFFFMNDFFENLIIDLRSIGIHFNRNTIDF
jgi:hypothetical protein